MPSYHDAAGGRGHYKSCRAVRANHKFTPLNLRHFLSKTTLIISKFWPKMYFIENFDQKHAGVNISALLAARYIIITLADRIL